MWVASYGVIPHAYSVAVPPGAASASAPLAVSQIIGCGPDPGRSGTSTGAHESMGARLSPAATCVTGTWRARIGWLPPGQPPPERAASKACARAISRGSLQAGPMNETPTGRPLTRPAGTVIDG